MNRNNVFLCIKSGDVRLDRSRETNSNVNWRPQSCPLVIQSLRMDVNIRNGFQYKHSKYSISPQYMISHRAVRSLCTSPCCDRESCSHRGVHITCLNADGAQTLHRLSPERTAAILRLVSNLRLDQITHEERDTGRVRLILLLQDDTSSWRRAPFSVRTRNRQLARARPTPAGPSVFPVRANPRAWCS